MILVNNVVIQRKGEYMKQYEWRQVNQWDAPKPEYYKKYEKVKTGISEGVCTFLLVEQTDINGDGYIRTQPVNKTDVTQEMLDIAGSV